MEIRGYGTGPIDAAGAFTSDIDLPPWLTPGQLCTVIEADRPPIVTMPGMRHKYLPMRHDPATAALTGGGRYLFRTYEDALGYRDFLEKCVMRGEATTFWNRPFFINPVRFAWLVYGAYDFSPIAEHDINRFERYTAPSEFEALSAEIFAALLEHSRRLDLAHVSLMHQPEHRLIGVVTTSSRGGRQSPSLQTVRHSIDAVEARGSASEAVLERLGARKVFDRTSLNITIWLPLSEQAGGAPAIWPNSPPIPLPGVEQPPQLQPDNLRAAAS